MKPTALPALSNAAPYHLVTDSSVEELNKKIPSLKERVDALNFRFDSSVFNKARSGPHKAPTSTDTYYL